MSVIRLKINETIIIKYTGEKIQITCKWDSLQELKQFPYFLDFSGNFNLKPI